MRYAIYKIFFLAILFDCKKGLTQDPTPRPYFSIEDSRKNKTFVAELKPQQAFIEIGGYKHYIKNAWIEHPHIKRNFGIDIGNDYYCFVMELEYKPNLNTDLSDYIKELGNGSTNVWFFLTNGKAKESYIKLQYRSIISNKKKDKLFYFTR